jgi:4-hydroxybenzoate polyprenyltransferase
MLGLLKVTRTWNLLIIVLAQYGSALFLANGDRVVDQVFFDPRIFMLVLSSVLIAAAGYIINDYYDVKIDLINKPGRVVIGKTLRRRVAMFFHIVFSFTGIVIGFVLSWKIGVIDLFSVGMLWLYSNQLKRLPFIGNFSVALLTGLSIYIVHFIYPDGHSWVLAYAAFAFSFTMIREIIKDMEDVKGDTAFGCRTLPVIYGIRRTKWVIYGLSVLFVLTLCLLSYYYVGYDLAIFSTGLVVPLGYLWWRLNRADTVKEFGFLSTYCKYVMLFGILSMVLF